jgi:DUF1680 family protein
MERGYIEIDLVQPWRDGDRVRLNLDMPVERIVANPNLKADQGLLAIQRGPLVYCLEQCDVKGPLASLYLPATAPLVVGDFLSGLPGGGVLGVRCIQGTAFLAPARDWKGRLYQAVEPPRRVEFTAVPYYAWDNRQPGPMKVWLPISPPVPPANGEKAGTE